jgi:hypothetical protein
MHRCNVFQYSSLSFHFPPCFCFSKERNRQAFGKETLSAQADQPVLPFSYSLKITKLKQKKTKSLERLNLPLQLRGLLCVQLSGRAEWSLSVWVSAVAALLKGDPDPSPCSCHVRVCTLTLTLHTSGELLQKLLAGTVHLGSHSNNFLANGSNGSHGNLFLICTKSPFGIVLGLFKYFLRMIIIDSSGGLFFR